MTVTTATPDSRPYEAAAKSFRSVLAQPKRVVNRPLAATVRTLDTEFQRQVDEAFREFETSS